MTHLPGTTGDTDPENQQELFSLLGCDAPSSALLDAICAGPPVLLRHSGVLRTHVRPRDGGGALAGSRCSPATRPRTAWPADGSVLLQRLRSLAGFSLVGRPFKLLVVWGVRIGPAADRRTRTRARAEHLIGTVNGKVVVELLTAALQESRSLGRRR